MIMRKRRKDPWIKTIFEYLKEREMLMTVIIEPGKVISRTASIVFVFASGCSCHHGCSSISPEKQGMPNQPLEAVVRNISEQKDGEDRVGVNAQKTFQVYSMPIPDETGSLNDEGLVTLKGDL